MTSPNVIFNFGDLSEEYRGRQALLMHKPYHRSVLRRLIARAEDLGQEPEKVIQKVSLNGDRKQFGDSGIRKSKDGIGWQVPTQKLVFQILHFEIFTILKPKNLVFKF